MKSIISLNYFTSFNSSKKKKNEKNEEKKWKNEKRKWIELTSIHFEIIKKPLVFWRSQGKQVNSFIQISLNVQSCKLYNKYLIASRQITNTEIFAFITVLVLSYWAVKFCLLTEKTIETAKFSGYFCQCFFSLHDSTFKFRSNI